MPEHLMELSVLDRPVFLRKILAELEDHGEVTQHAFDSKFNIPTAELGERQQYQYINCSVLPTLPVLQVGVKVSHHTMTANDPNPKPEKALVFVLDEVKDEPDAQGPGKDGKSRKRKRKSDKNGGFQPTAKNFGSRISINKVKSASKFVIGWRCRLGS